MFENSKSNFHLNHEKCIIVMFNFKQPTLVFLLNQRKVDCTTIMLIFCNLAFGARLIGNAIPINI